MMCLWSVLVLLAILAGYVISDEIHYHRDIKGLERRPWSIIAGSNAAARSQSVTKTQNEPSTLTMKNAV